MVFFFEYRSVYNMVKYDMWQTVRKTLPEECPTCRSTCIKPTGKTIYQLMLEVSNTDQPVKTKWICYNENCGGAFDFDLDKSVTEETPQEMAEKILGKIKH